MRVFDGFLVLVTFVSMISAIEQNAGRIMQLHRLPKHDHHSARYMRRLNTEEEAPEVVPLHLGLGTHYTWVYAGTPPQRASVIADTGSALMAFPCSGCEGCGNHTDQPFVTTNSSTLVHLTCAHESIFTCSECKVETDTCNFAQSYLEGSTWKATVVEDIVYLGGDSSFQDERMRNHYGTHFQFGCQTAETGLFITQVADGIMGLANTDHHIVAKLYHENKIAKNLFSLCFTEHGGTMAVGQPYEAAHRGTIEYVKLRADRSPTHFYSVHLKDIRINNVSINAQDTAYTRGQFIIDSGTTDSYLPRSMSTEFLKVFEKVSGRTYQSGEKCKSYTVTDLTSLPTIQYVLEAHGDEQAEVILHIPPEQYLYEIDGAYCGNLYLSENSGGVIGANLMTGRDVIFDLGNQRVGFVDADCAFDKTESTAPPSIAKSIDINETKGNASDDKDATIVFPTSAPVTTVVNESSKALKTLGTVKPSADSTESSMDSTPSAESTESPMDSTLVATKEKRTESTDENTTSDVENTLQSSVETTSQSDVNFTMQPLSNETPGPIMSSASAAAGDFKTPAKSSGTHPLVLTIVGAVLVVGFLVMMLISVSRRRQKDGKAQLWSRVKGDDADEDDDDEEEFGLVRNEKKRKLTKHERLQQEEDESSPSSSDDDEDEAFRMHHEAKTEDKRMVGSDRL